MSKKNLPKMREPKAHDNNGVIQKVSEVKALADRYNKSLRADDHRFQWSAVKIIDCEGTVISMSSAFLVRYGRWLIIFAEHHPVEVFHLDEIKYFRQYRETNIESFDLDKSGLRIRKHM